MNGGKVMEPASGIVGSMLIAQNKAISTAISDVEQDLDLQLLDALNKEGLRHRTHPVERIFCDQGESGVKGSRLEWDCSLAFL